VFFEILPWLFSGAFKIEIAVVFWLKAGWKIRNLTGTELQITRTATILNLVESAKSLSLC
jgi:hypothetical protein